MSELIRRKLDFMRGAEIMRVSTDLYLGVMDARDEFGADTVAAFTPMCEHGHYNEHDTEANGRAFVCLGRDSDEAVLDQDDVLFNLKWSTSLGHEYALSELLRSVVEATFPEHWAELSWIGAGV